jgi:hypothetical protein
MSEATSGFSNLLRIPRSCGLPLRRSVSIRHIVRNFLARPLPGFCTTGNLHIAVMRKLPVVLLCRRLSRLCRRANQMHCFGRPVPQRGVAQRHQRGTGCGGRGSVRRRSALKRTAKSCGPDAPTLSQVSRESFREATVAKEPGHRGARISRKPLRREGRTSSVYL